MRRRLCRSVLIFQWFFNIALALVPFERVRNLSLHIQFAQQMTVLEFVHCPVPLVIRVQGHDGLVLFGGQ